MKPGDRLKITKRTFLHKGIFVHTGSVVEVKSIDGDQLVVIYKDKEGYDHDIQLLVDDLSV